MLSPDHMCGSIHPRNEMTTILPEDESKPTHGTPIKYTEQKRCNSNAVTTNANRTTALRTGASAYAVELDSCTQKIG
jgi:hypothetical protein